MTSACIEVRGARVHNLKDVDVDIPHGKLTLVCGVSGSGKSSLALDTLYAEGQRRYIESFSAYARQFLAQLEKPEVDRIDGIPPAIAVATRSASPSHRATVGSLTETVEYLRLLFAKVGQTVCSSCGRAVQCDTPRSVAAIHSQATPGSRLVLVFFPEITDGNDTRELIGSLRENGFVRLVVGGSWCDLSDTAGDADVAARLANSAKDDVMVVVDRLTVGQVDEHRLAESLEGAFRHGDGRCGVLVEEASASPDAYTLAGRTWARCIYSDRMRCEACQRDYPLVESRLFSFNSPLGACPVCEGLGVTPAASAGRGKGAREKAWVTCAECQGARLRPESLATRIGPWNIAEISAKKICDLLEFFRSLSWSDWQRTVAASIQEQLIIRLQYLDQVGLGYLQLDRPLRSLSGGELQRVALTSVLGSSLVNMLYVLDEPSVGLHPSDVGPLLQSIRALQSRENTVVVVEHDETFLRDADHVIEVGPGAGETGGRIVFAGSPQQMLQADQSITGDYLAGRRGVGKPGSRRRPSHGWIRLDGASGNNLQNLQVEFPLGVLCLVTGVSGAGKSTLVEGTLYPALCERKRIPVTPSYPYRDVFGDGQIDDVILMDQRPLGRSARSNPVTYVKAFDAIREMFAETPQARTRNFPASYFSFNVAGGRCETCSGDGYLEMDMQFLPNVLVPCPACAGQRYRPEILEVTHRGCNIAEVLQMTVRQAFHYFRGYPKAQIGLKRLMDVGLDYVRLGQPASTLSGGEAQRLKLAGYLSTMKRNRTLFLLDEPTTGLHNSDVIQLLDCFDALLSVGHSLIVVEHNVQLMKAADFLIDLGPGAADAGGRVVACGTPEEIARNPESRTGRCLREQLEC